MHVGFAKIKYEWRGDDRHFHDEKPGVTCDQVRNRESSDLKDTVFFKDLVAPKLRIEVSLSIEYLNRGTVARGPNRSLLSRSKKIGKIWRRVNFPTICSRSISWCQLIHG